MTLTTTPVLGCSEVPRNRASSSGRPLVEIDYWIRKRMHPDVWRVFMEDVNAGAYLVVELSARERLRAVELASQYANLDLGFVDAAVIAVCESLGEKKVATLDRRHFGVVRPAHCERLQLLPDDAPLVENTPRRPR